MHFRPSPARIRDQAPRAFAAIKSLATSGATSTDRAAASLDCADHMQQNGDWRAFMSLRPSSEGSAAKFFGPATGSDGVCPSVEELEAIQHELQRMQSGLVGERRSKLAHDRATLSAWTERPPTTNGRTLSVHSAAGPSRSGPKSRASSGASSSVADLTLTAGASSPEGSDVELPFPSTKKRCVASSFSLTFSDGRKKRKRDGVIQSDSEYSASEHEAPVKIRKIDSPAPTAFALSRPGLDRRDSGSSMASASQATGPSGGTPGPISLKLKMPTGLPPKPPPRKGPLPHGVADDFNTAPRTLMPPPPVSIPPRGQPTKQTDVHDDFSKAKPSNQTPFTTWQNTLEPYLRPFAEDDLAWLATKTDDLTPFIVPPLGRHYAELWAEEEAMAGMAPTGPAMRMPPGAQLEYATLQPLRPENVTEEQLVMERMHVGPLAERLLASLTVPQLGELTNASAVTNNGQLANGEASLPPDNMDAVELEDRVKRELKYLGVVPPPIASTSAAVKDALASPTTFDPDWSQRTDDDVSAALRACQRKLREQMAINEARKAKLSVIVRDRLARQEFETLRDALEKQIETGYIRRHRHSVTHKQAAAVKQKGAPAAEEPEIRTPNLPEGLADVLRKRKRLLEAVKPIFEAPSERPRFFGIPQESIYADDPVTRYEPPTESAIREHNERAASTLAGREGSHL